jgi:hypothetical protein
LSQWLHQRYSTFNRQYFGGRLPTDTVLMWTTRLPPKVCARKYKLESGPQLILFNRRLEPWQDVIEMSLLHEMAHMATVNNHGRRWQQCMLALAKMGAFKDRW